MQQREKSDDAYGDPRQCGSTRLRNECAGQPCDRSKTGKKHVGIEKEQRVAPVRAEIAPQGAARDVVDKGKQSARNAFPCGLLARRRNEVVPADEAVTRLDAPICAVRQYIP
jgi:hypothetical protein